MRVYGEDLEVLRSEAEKVRQALAGIDGVVDSHVVLPLRSPRLEIEVDLAAAQRYGVKPGDVRRAAATLLSGLQVGSLFEEQKVFDVVVWSTPETRESLTDIRDLLIDTPGGGHVRLGEVADVRIASSPTVIRREAVSPYLDVRFNVQGRMLSAVANDVKAPIQNFTFPLEYHAEVLGDYAARQAAQQRILIAGDRRGDRDIPPPAGGPPGAGAWLRDVFLTLPAGAGQAACWQRFLRKRRLVSLGSLVGCFTILGIAAAQRRRADQSLSASRGAGR